MIFLILLGMSLEAWRWNHPGSISWYTISHQEAKRVEILNIDMHVQYILFSNLLEAVVVKRPTAFPNRRFRFDGCPLPL